ncbi:MAG: hypothetical protein FJ288_06710 [Planctomycetes bacterium]|nr:hypothetical protein [Planctomycetota bacterium]
MEILFAGAAGALQCFFFAVVAAAVVGVIIYAVYRAGQRREAMARLAAEWGLRFYAADPYDIPARYAHVDLFGRGHARRASNVLAGQVDGREVILCDYRYKTGSGKDEHTHSFQVAILGMPILAPRMHMRRESFLDTMASWVGFDDLDFESEEFSRRYHVKADDRKFAYDVLHARLIQYLLACGDVPALEMNGPLLVLHDDQDGAERVRRLLDIGGEIIRSIPDYVRAARGTGGQQGGRT